MRRILIVSTVSRQFYLFEKGNIEVLKSLGYEVHCAANYDDENERLNNLGIIRHPIDIQRNPLSLKNFKAYKQLKNIIKLMNFDAIHCHSPIGGVLSRMAAKKLHFNTIFYTAHGFHFYKGAPLRNWIIYYFVERYLSRFTDTIITINDEDYRNALGLRAKNVIKIPGVGIDNSIFQNTSIYRQEVRESLHIDPNTIVIMSIGELNKNKNHKTSIRSIANINDKNFIYLICGEGKYLNELQKYANKLNVNDKVIFLGYRNDIPKILSASDIFLFPSRREGLPVSVMEAMSTGIPIIASRIRGNIDLLESTQDFLLHHPNDYLSFAKSISHLIRNTEIRFKIGFDNKKYAQNFDKKIVNEIMQNMYKERIEYGQK